MSKVGPSDVSVRTMSSPHEKVGSPGTPSFLQQAALAFMKISEKHSGRDPTDKGYETIYYLFCRLTLSFFTVTSRLR